MPAYDTVPMETGELTFAAWLEVWSNGGVEIRGEKGVLDGDRNTRTVISSSKNLTWSDAPLNSLLMLRLPAKSLAQM